jgi:hypothetical protein
MMIVVDHNNSTLLKTIMIIVTYITFIEHSGNWATMFPSTMACTQKDVSQH